MIDIDAFNTCFFNGTFDEEALYTPSGGSATPVNVIFDNGYHAAQFQEADGQIESKGPKATCSDSDVVGVAHGDTFLIRGDTWYVIEVQPDGTGLVTLLLSKDPLP